MVSGQAAFSAAEKSVIQDAAGGCPRTGWVGLVGLRTCLLNVFVFLHLSPIPGKCLLPFHPVWPKVYLRKSSSLGIRRSQGFPCGASGKKPSCQCRRCKRPSFRLWVGKIPCRRARQPTPVFLPGESRGQRSLVGSNACCCAESDTAEAT